jgi:hypothetical protein
METDPVFEKLCSVLFRIPDHGQSPKTQLFCHHHHHHNQQQQQE